MGLSLEEVTDRIFQGLKTSADSIYILDVVERKSKTIRVSSKILQKEVTLETVLLKPLIKGGQMVQYLIEEPEKVILFPYKDAKLISKKEIKEIYPRCWEYLATNKKYLEEREGGIMKGENWFAYGRNQALDVIHLPKIITPDLALLGSYCYDSSGSYYFTGGAAGGYGILSKEGINPKYLLALLNSRLLDWFHHQGSTRFRGGYFSYESRFIKSLPICTIDFNNPQEKKQHDDLVNLTDVMLNLRKQEQKAQGHELDLLQRQIEKTDREIDERVYELYGIIGKEKEIIEKENR